MKSSLYMPLLHRSALALCLVATAACTNPTEREPQVTPRGPSSSLRLASTAGCQIDSDCAEGLFCMQSSCVSECLTDSDCLDDSVCSDNGRCLDAAAAAAAQLTASTQSAFNADQERYAQIPSSNNSIRFKNLPPSVVEIERTDTHATIILETETDVPEGAILYRWELDGAGTSTEALRAEGTRRFTLQIPVGIADGSLTAPQPQFVTVTTSIGDFSTIIRQSNSLSGEYAGDIVIPQFGGNTLPFRFSLQVEPADATLDTADRVFMSWPSSVHDLFALNGVPENTTTAWERRELEYDIARNTWFARFASPFAFPEGSTFAHHATPQRALRIELWSADNYTIHGALADRWSGLFATVNANGIASPGQFVVTGNFIAARAGALREDVGNDVANPGTLTATPVPDPSVITACSPAVFQDLATQADLACDGIGDLTAFGAVVPMARLQCAHDIGEVALSGPTTSQLILDFMDEETENPAGISFAQFLERCAARDGYCVPSEEVLCAAELVSNAYRRFNYQSVDPANMDSARALVNDSLALFQGLSRETYLGSQLAAYHVDTQTRLGWLKTSIAPSFLASELRALNETVLTRWEQNVLQAHYQALSKQLTPSALDVLSRVPEDALSQETREAILLDNIQSWQGTMDALQLAANRWHEVYTMASARKSAADKVRRQSYDLYVSAGLLSYLAQGSAFASTAANFGSGFASLIRATHRLNSPYSELLFARDAEVVLPRSADPTQDQSNLLSERAQLAKTAIRDAQTSVDIVLAESLRNEISAEVLTNSSRTQRDELRTELIQLCGVPLGCDSSDVGTVVGCEVATAEGACGFIQASMTTDSVELNSSLFNTSEAGSALYKILSAGTNERIRGEELRAQRERLRIAIEETQAFEASIRTLDRNRRTQNASIQAYADEIRENGLSALAEVGEKYGAMATARTAAFDAQRASIDELYTFETEGASADYTALTKINGVRRTADMLGVSAELTENLLDAAVDLIGDDGPTGWTQLKAGLKAGGALGSFALAMGGAAETARAADLEATMELNRALADANITKLQSLSELNARISEGAIAKLTDELNLLNLKSEHEIRTRQAMIDTLKRTLEADEIFERDLQELRDRQARMQVEALAIAVLEEQVIRANIQTSQAYLEYQLIAQRAGLLQGRFQLLSARLQNIENILGSPSAIFTFANRIARAESRVERAKSALYDWLVALEYYAVRPFMDQRMAVLLARNPSELEAISNELARLQRACGGPVNRESLDISVRDHLMGLSAANAVDGTSIILSPADRFRAALNRKAISVSAKARYGSDQTVLSLLRRQNTLATEFKIRLSEFANLPLTCNAKILSFGIQIVGEGLDETHFPTVSLVHDGASELTSCQPNIDALVSAVAPGSTQFGRITTFRTAGRTVAPVARVNSFGEPSTHNRGLEGLPLSSTYALLIDPAAGDNRYIDWSKIDDIRLLITYTYQDVFAAGQCQ